MADSNSPNSRIFMPPPPWQHAKSGALSSRGKRSETHRSVLFFRAPLPFSPCCRDLSGVFVTEQPVFVVSARWRWWTAGPGRRLRCRGGAGCTADVGGAQGRWCRVGDEPPRDVPPLFAGCGLWDDRRGSIGRAAHCPRSGMRCRAAHPRKRVFIRVSRMLLLPGSVPNPGFPGRRGHSSGSGGGLAQRLIRPALPPCAKM